MIAKIENLTCKIYVVYFDAVWTCRHAGKCTDCFIYFIMPVAPLLVSPTSEQPVPAGSHDVPKFGGLGDLPSARQVSPPVSSSNNATEEESGSEEDEDDSKHDNPITSTPMLQQQQPISNQQVIVILKMVTVYSHMLCVAWQVVCQYTQLYYAVQSSSIGYHYPVYVCGV